MVYADVKSEQYPTGKMIALQTPVKRTSFYPYQIRISEYFKKRTQSRATGIGNKRPRTTKGRFA